MSDTRWLDDEQQRTWRSFLSADRLMFERIERQLTQEAGLPHAYYEILVRLSEAPDKALRMSQLAESSMSSRSRLSHAVARMEESGWIRRTPSSEDRRGSIAELTPAGMDKLRSIAPGHVEEVRSVLFDLLDRDQQRALKQICDTIVDALSDGPGWPTRADAPATAPDSATA